MSITVKPISCSAYGKQEIATPILHATFNRLLFAHFFSDGFIALAYSGQIDSGGKLPACFIAAIPGQGYAR